MPVLIQLLAALALCFVTGCASTKQTTEPLAAHWEHPDSPVNGSRAALTQTNQAFSDLSSIAIAPLSDSNPVVSSPAPLDSTITVPAASRIPAPALALVSLRDWSRKHAFSMQKTGPEGQSCTLSSPSGQIQIIPGSRVARFNGIDVHLGYPAQSISGQVYVQNADIRSTLEPLLLSAQHAFHPGKLIVLDAGHGGQDAGTRSPSGGREKDFTLDWALRLKELLAADGWSVVLTRPADTDLALSNRVSLAQAASAGLFLSLHFNSASPDIAGVETYCLTPAGVPSTLTRGYADELDTKFSGNDFDEQNIQLAVRVHKALLEVNGNRDRGVRRARFPAVLRGQQCPALLIEGGYLSNQLEAGLVATASHRQRLAEAVASALRPFAPSPAFQAAPTNNAAIEPNNHAVQ